MRLRHPILCSVMSSIITIALSLSPVMAQSTQDAGSAITATQVDETARTVKESRIPIVDTAVLPELPLATTATTFPNVTRNSTPAAAPNPTKPGADVEPGGQSKWVILAAIIITGAVVGTILLLRGWGGGDKSKPAPTGTIITPGTPSIAVPSH